MTFLIWTKCASLCDLIWKKVTCSGWAWATIDTFSQRCSHVGLSAGLTIIYTALFVRESSDPLLGKYTNPYIEPGFWSAGSKCVQTNGFPIDHFPFPRVKYGGGFFFWPFNSCVREEGGHARVIMMGIALRDWSSIKRWGFLNTFEGCRSL